MRYSYLFFLLLIFSSTAQAQTFTNNESAKEELLQLKRTYVTAFFNADTKTMGNILADDFKMVSESNVSVNKETFLKNMPTSPIKGGAVKDTLTEVRFFGETGIITGMTVTSFDGRNGFYEMITDVYTRKKGTWLLASSHKNRIPLWMARKLHDSEFTTLTGADCSEEGKIKVLDNNVRTLVRFKNNTSGDITAYWLDNKGSRRTDATFIIKAGQAYDLTSFATHPFLIVDANGKCLGIYQVATRPSIIYMQ